ncbi:hypothetical protein BJ742DRAFT_772161 [Cladochytrium replicatum]|nr:hypothetical protein BJ742DRAFT_772161 [Cladochytrium replicatum]
MVETTKKPLKAVPVSYSEYEARRVESLKRLKSSFESICARYESEALNNEEDDEIDLQTLTVIDRGFLRKRKVLEFGQGWNLLADDHIIGHESPGGDEIHLDEIPEDDDDLVAIGLDATDEEQMGILDRIFQFKARIGGTDAPASSGLLYEDGDIDCSVTGGTQPANDVENDSQIIGDDVDCNAAGTVVDHDEKVRRVGSRYVVPSKDLESKGINSDGESGAQRAIRKLDVSTKASMEDSRHRAEERAISPLSPLLGENAESEPSRSSKSDSRAGGGTRENTKEIVPSPLLGIGNIEFHQFRYSSDGTAGKRNQRQSQKTTHIAGRQKYRRKTFPLSSKSNDEAEGSVGQQKKSVTPTNCLRQTEIEIHALAPVMQTATSDGKTRRKRTSQLEKTLRAAQDILSELSAHSINGITQPALSLCVVPGEQSSSSSFHFETENEQRVEGSPRRSRRSRQATTAENGLEVSPPTQILRRSNRGTSLLSQAQTGEDGNITSPPERKTRKSSSVTIRVISTNDGHEPQTILKRRRSVGTEAVRNTKRRRRSTGDVGEEEVPSSDKVRSEKKLSKDRRRVLFDASPPSEQQGRGEQAELDRPYAGQNLSNCEFDLDQDDACVGVEDDITNVTTERRSGRLSKLNIRQSDTGANCSSTGFESFVFEDGDVQINTDMIGGDID